MEQLVKQAKVIEFLVGKNYEKLDKFTFNKITMSFHFALRKTMNKKTISSLPFET